MKWITFFLTLLLVFTPFSLAKAEETPEVDYELFYDHQVFVGDSITRQLKIYIKEQMAKGVSLPEPTFLTAQSYMLYTASRRNLINRHTNILYRGRETPLCRAIGQIQPKRVFILLGVNDYAGKDIPKHIGYCERIVDLIAEYSPDTQVYFFSLTPVTPRFSGSADLNTLWDEYNLALKEMCIAKGAIYIDISTPLKDENGYLKAEYCSDDRYHLSPAGLQVWLDTMRSFAKSQYEEGLWTPGEDDQ